MSEYMLDTRPAWMDDEDRAFEQLIAEESGVSVKDVAAVIAALKEHGWG